MSHNSGGFDRSQENKNNIPDFLREMSVKASLVRCETK